MHQLPWLALQSTLLPYNSPRDHRTPRMLHDLLWQNQSGQPPSRRSASLWQPLELHSSYSTYLPVLCVPLPSSEACHALLDCWGPWLEFLLPGLGTCPTWMGKNSHVYHTIYQIWMKWINSLFVNLCMNVKTYRYTLLLTDLYDSYEV